jgi:hypothetical protein
MRSKLPVFVFSLIFMMGYALITYSQESNEEAQQPPLLIATTVHANWDYKEGTAEDWLAMEKLYFDKVTSKNEYLMRTNVLQHYYTEDNSELIFARVYKDWGSIEKAAKRDQELIEEAWPDEAEREAFFKKQSMYYTDHHSDEIYRAVQGAKLLSEEDRAAPHVYYVRTSHTAWPEDGEDKEIMDMHAEYTKQVIHMNPLLLAYYPYMHYYGADSRDFVEVFVVKSLADIENSAEINNELVEAHWPDEDKRKAFFKRFDQYQTGWHADRIFQNIPELMK